MNPWPATSSWVPSWSGSGPHVVMNQDAAVAVALWVAFSWVHDKAAVHVRSIPTPRRHSPVSRSAAFPSSLRRGATSERYTAMQTAKIVRKVCARGLRRLASPTVRAVRCLRIGPRLRQANLEKGSRRDQAATGACPAGR